MGCTEKFVVGGRPVRRRAARGFTLIELMCVVTIFGIMTTLSVFSVNSIMAGRQIANNAYELAGLIRAARTAAIAQNTYVAVAFSETKQGNNSALMVATVAAKSGQLSDFQTSGRYQLLSKCAVLKDVQFASRSEYANLPAVDVTTRDYKDITDSTLLLSQVAVGGNQQLNFTNALIINPNGEISINNDWQPTRCLGIGLEATTSSKDKPRLSVVQVTGLNGDVAVFLQ